MLKDRFNVSHTPIREALTRLSENGLVTYYSNCGVTVTEFTDSDIRQIFQFIGELDALAVRFLQKTRLLMRLWSLNCERFWKTAMSCCGRGKIAEWKDYSEKFHTAFYHHAQNEYLNEAAKRCAPR